MTVTINGTTGIDKVQDGSIVQADLASGVAGTGPAFSAYNNTNQTINNGTITKVLFQVEDFDTANCFDNVTSYRFTPNVAGYYQVNGLVYCYLNASRVASYVLLIYKNGSPYARQQAVLAAAGSNTDYSNQISQLVYMNGTTDYIEIYQIIYDLSASAGGVITGGSQYTRFSASLVRAA